MPADTTLASRESWREFVQSFDAVEQPEHRRRAARHDVGHGFVEVYELPQTTKLVTTGTVINVSENALMLRTRASVGIAMQIRIELGVDDDEFVLIGEVRHCTPTVGGYKLGVELLWE